MTSDSTVTWTEKVLELVLCTVREGLCVWSLPPHSAIAESERCGRDEVAGYIQRVAFMSGKWCERFSIGSQNKLSWKGPPRVTKPSSRPCTAPSPAHDN